MGQDMRVHGGNSVPDMKKAKSDMPGQTGVFSGGTGFNGNPGKTGPVDAPIVHEFDKSKMPGQNTNFNNGQGFNGQPYSGGPLQFAGRSDIVRPVQRKENMSSLVDSFMNGYLKGE